jgi:dihydrofolate reductase
MADGPELRVHSGGDFFQTLLKNDLIDEFWLKIRPITLGKEKRMTSKTLLPQTSLL